MTDTAAKPNGQPDLLEEAEKLRHQCLNIERHIEKEIMRFDLQKRELIVLLMVIRVSLGQGRPSVRVPKLEILADLTGLPVSHIHTTIRGLCQMRILSFKKLPVGGWLFSVNLASDNWSCRQRQPSRLRIYQALETLKAVNGETGVEEEPGENFSADPAVLSFLAEPITTAVKFTDSGKKTWVDQLSFEEEFKL